MFGLQPFHLLIILAVALIVFGPSRLPELGRMLGKSLTEFKQATANAGDELRKGLDEQPSNAALEIRTSAPAMASVNIPVTLPESTRPV